MGGPRAPFIDLYKEHGLDPLCNEFEAFEHLTRLLICKLAEFYALVPDMHPSIFADLDLSLRSAEGKLKYLQRVARRAHRTTVYVSTRLRMLAATHQDYYYDSTVNFCVFFILNFLYFFLVKAKGCCHALD